MNFFIIFAKNEKVFNEYLSSKLSTMKIWENKKIWEAIYKYLLNKKIEDKKKSLTNSDNTSINLSNINALGKVMIKNIWKVGKSVMGLSESSHKQQEANANQNNEKEMVYSALDEVNFHMINLGLKNELTIDLIIELGLQ